MHAVWGAGQMAWTKIIIVVDDDVDVHNDDAVLRAVFENCHFARDLELVNGPLDILDHAAPRLGAGHKLGIDATRKCRGEEVGGIPIEQMSSAIPTVLGKNFRSVTEVVDAHLPEFGNGRCLFVSIDKNKPGQGARAIEACFKACEADFIIAVDRSVNVQDTENVLFHLCANADPGRDIIRINNRIGFDATHKIPGDERSGQPVRDYPPILEMSHEIKTRVLARWSEYGFE